MSDKKTDKPNDANCATHGRVVGAEKDRAGQLVVRLEGRDGPVVGARVARSFPWSVPDSYISVLDADGKEVALLDSLDELDAESRSIIEAELAEKVFNPKIRRVIDAKHEFGITLFTVETDRGRVKFQIRTRDDVRVLSATRALFRDVDGNTYELEDLSALDRDSRKHVSRYF